MTIDHIGSGVAGDAAAGNPSPPEVQGSGSRRPASGAADGWWDDLYRHQNADLDTHSGTPRTSTSTSTDRQDPADPIEDAVPAPASALAPADLVKQADDLAEDVPESGLSDIEDAAEEVEERRRVRRLVELVWSERAASGAVQTGSHLRARQVLFSASAAVAGWGLGLNKLVDLAITETAAYPVQISGVALGTGLLAAYLRVKSGGVLLVASIALTGLLGSGHADWVAAGGLSFVLWVIDARIRLWLRSADPTAKAWKAVAWILRIPLATAVTVLLLHGTH